MYILLSEKGNVYVIKGPGVYTYPEGKVVIDEKDFMDMPVYKITSTGKKMVLTSPLVDDLIKKFFERKAQIIHPKDISYIIYAFFKDKDIRVLEAGSGSGYATLHLSFFAKEVVSFEKRKEFYEVAKRNIDFFGRDNVTLVHGDVLEIEEENSFDIVVFDFKEAYTRPYIRIAKKALKVGGYIVLYLPVMEQVSQAIKNLRDMQFVGISLKEIFLREWKIDPLRPHNKMLSHTAFLVCARKFE